MRTFLCAAVFAATLPALPACADRNGAPSYPDLASCVTDHVGQGMSEPHAITTCLIDHLMIDFDNIDACLTYVTDHGGYPDSRVPACDDFFAELDRIDGGV